MLIRSDWVIASIFRRIDSSYTATPIHWPGTDVNAEDTAWIEPDVTVTRTPGRKKRDYGILAVEINVFQRETESTYAVWKNAGILAQILRDSDIQIRNWPDGGTVHVGYVRLFEPISTPLVPGQSGGPSGGRGSSNMQQINVRIEGVFMGDQ